MESIPQTPAKRQSTLMPATMVRAHQADNFFDSLLIVWRAIEPDWDKLTGVNPSAYAIPQGQTAELLEGPGFRLRLAKANAKSHVDAAELACCERMEWINIGPSSFDEDCEVVV